MFVRSRRIADDTETDERHAVEMAYLGNGSRFHIDRKSFGKVLLDGIQFRAVGDEFIARANQSAVNRRFGIERERAII